MCTVQGLRECCSSLVYCGKEGTAENLSLGKPFVFPWEKFLIGFMGEGRKRVLDMYYRVSRKKTPCIGCLCEVRFRNSYHVLRFWTWYVFTGEAVGNSSVIFFSFRTIPCEIYHVFTTYLYISNVYHLGINPWGILCERTSLVSTWTQTNCDISVQSERIFQSAQWSVDSE